MPVFSAGPSGIAAEVAALPLVDHHCHGLVTRELDRAGVEDLLTEADGSGPLGGSLFDSQIGLALRRWCAPVLDLEPHVPVDAYLARRAELGRAEVDRRMVAATGIATFLVDTGYLPEPLTTPAELAALAGATAGEVVRLETVAEEVLGAGCSAAGFGDAVRARLSERAAGAVAVKTVAAYRGGLDLDGARPTPGEVAAAAGAALRAVDAGAGPRVADPVLHRFLVWCGVDLGRPVQVHVGYGDADIDLHRSDPLLLTGLLRATRPTGVPVMLLHNYPFHRRAGYLAQVFPHVFVDVGLATHNVGRRAGAVLAELLELAPFGKVLFSTDACALGELYLLASTLFRRALGRLLADGVADDDWTADDALRIAAAIGSGNAVRAYRLPGGEPPPGGTPVRVPRPAV
ncbi:amidohydrolase family protein [Geodermatophilus sp. CPCC 205506]|uniref:amidohydrolase family protein n=1 Tax=Geodermatophilus sp. CPCC 205506 TaxID=2936596 RepID=UPI003EF06C75